MKKFKLIVFISIILFIAFGIIFFVKKYSKPKNKNLNFLNTEFSANAVINIDKKNYECHFSHYSGTTKISLKKPETVKDLSIEWSNGKQKISFKNIKKEVNNQIFPKDSFLNSVVEIFNNLSEISINKIKDDGRREIFSGKLGGNEFEISSEKSKIIEIHIKNKDAKINFEYED